MRLIESYFYRPLWWQKIFIFTLLPFSVIYCIIAFLRRKLVPKSDLHIPIISIGNLIVGGSGKTPFLLELANQYPHLHIGVVSRGYKRKSKGLLVVSKQGEILSNPEEAGDEPYLIAKSLSNASVIVCKNRTKAIYQAKEMGCDFVLLDDGFRFCYKKLNLILKPKLEPYYPFCLPSGMYREWIGSYKEADILIQEGKDYQRQVKVQNPTQRMLLLTAIAHPSRLDEFLPSVVGKITYADHATFCKEEIAKQIQHYQATSILVTTKDYVKLESMGFEISLLTLKLHIHPNIQERISSYLKENLCDYKKTH